MTNKLTGDARTALMADVATEMQQQHDDGTCVHPAGESCPAAGVQRQVDELSDQLAANHSKLPRPSTMTVRDLALIRQAVLTVIDDGDPRTPKDSKGNPIWSPQWNIYSANEAVANAARLRLVNAVQQYIVAHVKEGE